MSKLKLQDPIKFLDEYRGTKFKGEWPTIPEMFDITTERNANRACFTDFEGPDGAKNTLNYTQAHDKIVQLSKWLSANGVKHGDKLPLPEKTLLSGLLSILQPYMRAESSVLWIMP